MSVALLVPIAAEGCDDKGSAKDAGDGDDGRHQFRTFGKWEFSERLSAHQAPRGGAGCRWHLETEPKAGLKPGEKPRVIDGGGYGNAKIRVQEPDTVKVFIVTKSCGVWKKT